MSSLEIAIRRQPELRFISHIEVIRNASSEAREATCPLAIPLPSIDDTFGAVHRAELGGTHLKPDALFGIQYPPLDDPDFRFFALEYDRGTEDVEPTRNLRRSSWLRKILSYDAVSADPHPVHETYLRIPNPSERQGKAFIFKALLTRYGWTAPEVCVVGDNPGSELKAGTQLGMITIQIIRPTIVKVSGFDYYAHDFSEVAQICNKLS